MKTKKEIRYFSIFNHEKEQDYLIDQHQRGWKFIKVTGLGVYHFVECQPEHVIYQLDFNQEASREKQEYIRMFEDCGWEYLQEYAGFSYFRKSADQMTSTEEIFCDENSRLEMLDRVYKGRLVPLLIIFSACLLPQFIMNLFNGNYVLVVIYGFIIGVYAALFGYSAYHYYRKKIELNNCIYQRQKQMFLSFSSAKIIKSLFKQSVIIIKVYCIEIDKS